MNEFRHEPEPRAEIESDSDVEEILRLAVRKADAGSGDLRDRLRSTASELGISEEALARAEEEWSQRRADEGLVEEYKRKLRKDLGGAITGLITPVAIISAIDWFTGGGLTWSLFVSAIIVASSIAGIVSPSRVFFPNSSMFKDGFEEWKEKRAKREERQRLKRLRRAQNNDENSSS